MIRPVSETDIDFIASLYGDWKVARFLNRIPFPYGIEDAENTTHGLIAANQNKRNLNAIVTMSGKSVGILVVNAISEKRAVLGFSILPEFQRKGIATRACKLAIDHAISAGFTEIQSSPLQENIASSNLLKKLGFVVEEQNVMEESIHSGIRKADRYIKLLPQPNVPGNEG